MSTHLPGFQSFFLFLHHFILAKLANSCIRVKHDHLPIMSLLCGALYRAHRAVLSLSSINWFLGRPHLFHCGAVILSTFCLRTLEANALTSSSVIPRKEKKSRYIDYLLSNKQHFHNINLRIK